MGHHGNGVVFVTTIVHDGEYLTVYINPETPASPAAPVPKRRGAVCALIPPSAIIGQDALAHIFAKASGPMGVRALGLSLSKTGDTNTASRETAA